jgi:hypothetical protein
LLSDDAIIWPDGTRSSLPPHPSVIIGNKPSVRAGIGRLRRQGQGRCAAGRSERAEQHALGAPCPLMALFDPALSVHRGKADAFFRSLLQFLFLALSNN